jgi:hypothetical protein
MGPFKSDRKIKMIKLFNVKIRAYGYIADFNIRAEDTKESIENSILDKIGQNGVLLRDSDRAYSKFKCWITYEEILDGSSTRPLQEEKVVGTQLGTETHSRGNIHS